MQAEAAVQRELLPPVVPHNYAPTTVPRPVFQVEDQVPSSAHCNPFSSTDEGPGGTAHAAVERPSTQNGEVPRRKSVTPRSILDFEEAVTGAEQAGGACAAGDGPSPCKRQKVDQ